MIDPARHADLHISDHELLHPIGKGSYGEVWLARNIMGIYRAVKFVFRDSFDTDRPFERERQGIERFEPVSRSHEGFVDILHIGQGEGYFYYVMELGDDVELGPAIEPQSYSPKTLEKQIAAGHLPVEKCLELGLSLSNALNHLHRQDLVHRDIKPSNIIFVGGVPKLADIGLVAGINDRQSIVGTLGYIPPEGTGSPRADIYSLGKVLYEMSTGLDRQEFPALPVAEAQIMADPLFLELNEIILKACQNDPLRRYGSAREMHAELAVLENGRSIKRLRLLERRLLTLRRGAVAAGVALAVAALVGFQAMREREFRRDGVNRRIAAHTATGLDRLDEGDLTGSLPSLVAALRLTTDKSAVEMQRFRIGAILGGTARLQELLQRESVISSCEYSRDGARLMTIGQSNAVEVFDRRVGGGSIRFGPKRLGYGVAISPDGETVATASQMETEGVQLWNSRDGRLLRRLDLTNGFHSVQFSPDGKWLAAAGMGGAAHVWNAVTGERWAIFGENLREVMLYASFSPDGRQVFTSGKDGVTRVWSMDTKEGRELTRQGGWVYRVIVSADGKRILLPGTDKRVRVVDSATGQDLLPPLFHPGMVVSARFSPDGRFIATACLDSNVRIWSSQTGLPATQNRLLRTPAPLGDLAYSPEGDEICAVGTDGAICVWSLVPADRGLIERPDGPGEPGERRVLSEDGQFVIRMSASDKLAPGKMQVFFRDDGKPRSKPIATPAGAESLVVTRQGDRGAVWAGKKIFLFDLESGAPLFELENPAPVNRLFFDRGARILATVAVNQVYVWDLQTHLMVAGPLVQESEVSHVTFDGAGKWMVVCCTDPFLSRRSAHFFSTSGWTESGSALRHDDGVLHAVFSPDGRFLVTSSEDGTAVIWDVASRTEAAPPLAHAWQVNEAAVDATGDRIVTASFDNSFRLWNAHTGEPLSPRMDLGGPSMHAVFQSSREILFWNRVGNARIYQWKVFPEERPVADLADLAQVLTAARTRVGRTAEPLPKILARLRAAYPREFEVTVEQKLHWHRQELKRSIFEKSAMGEAFHQDWIRRLGAGAGPSDVF